MWFRFSLASLMIAVVGFAVGFAALYVASPLWASGVFTVTVFLLATATVWAIAGRGTARIAWLGFAVFGWTYMLAAFWLWPAGNGVTAPPFLTKVLLDTFQPTYNTATAMTVDPGPPGEAFTEFAPMVSTPIPGSTNLTRTIPFAGRVVNLLNYRRIGHSLAAIAFSLLGALLGAVIAARTETTSHARQASPDH